MREYGQSSFPLTVAQRGLWFSQKMTPRALMNIAEAVEICGKVEPAIFQRALRQIIAETEQFRIRIVEQDGKPCQILCPQYQGDFPYIDMSREPDPRAAIEAWMREEWSRSIDPACDLMWTSVLLKQDDHRYFWYQRAHHIIQDGYGGGLIARRMAELYTAYAQDKEPEPNLFCTVQAMVEAEASYRNSHRFQRDRGYWLKQMADMPKAVTLTCQPHRHELSSSLRRSTGYFPSDMVQQLAKLGKGMGISLPQIWIGLIAAYYHRFTGASDLVFRMPVSGRVKGVLRSSVGVSANIVPIRLSFSLDMTAVQLFAQVKRVVHQALRHQQYRYEDLRRDLGVVGQDQNIAWLGINIEPFDYRLNFNGAEAIPHNLSNSGAEDLMVFVYYRSTGADVRFDLDAHPSLYTVSELEEHKRRLMRLVEQVLAQPDKPLQQVDILGEEESYRLRVDWNNTAKTLAYTNLPALVSYWAQTTPNAPAILFEGISLNYQQLHDRSVSYAHHLIASGIKPGDRVAVALPRSEQLLIVLLAIMRAGAAYLPLDVNGPAERTVLVLEDALPVALIAPLSFHHRFTENDFIRLQPDYPHTVVANDVPVPDLSAPDGVVYVLYTSGSTGKPKGVEVTHRNVANFLQGMQFLLNLTASDRFLAITTLIFDIAGLELYLPLKRGACVVIASSETLQSPPALARLIQQSGITHIQSTPSLWRILLANASIQLDNINVLIGGEVLSAELASKLKRRAARVIQCYGPTETTIWSTACELAAIEHIPPIGRPLLNTQLYVLDEGRQLVPTGAIGELYIGGAGVAKGYLNRPDLTEKYFVDNPFTRDGSRLYRTGDRVRWNDEGLLEFIGRVNDDQVKINGHRVELGEIESVLRQHASVAEAAVSAHKKDDGSLSLTAYVVLSEGEKVDSTLFRSFLTRRLSNSMIPDSFMLLDAMPLSPNGKLDRKQLPVTTCITPHRYVEPITPTEKKLALLWQKILKVDQVGLHDNFFDLGGDSLSVAEFIAHFHSSFEMELPMNSLFEAPTIESLAEWIASLSKKENDLLGVILPLRKVSRTIHYPLFCIHPIAGFSLGFSALLRHLDANLPVYGLQSRGLSGGHLPLSIEEIAADYLKQIRHIQPEGPYRLLGRSLGGLIAHCLAAQMQEQDLQVELLAMIDSCLFLSEELHQPLTEAEEVRAALSFLDIHLDQEEKQQQALNQLGHFLLHPDNINLVPRNYQGMITLTQTVIKDNPEFHKNLINVILNNLKLARQYRPRKVDSDLVYFHAIEMTGDVDTLIQRHPSAWQPYISGKMDVFALGCHHEAVLDPEPAAQIGNVLAQRLCLGLDNDDGLNIPPLVIEAEENPAVYA